MQTTSWVFGSLLVMQGSALLVESTFAHRSCERWSLEVDLWVLNLPQHSPDWFLTRHQLRDVREVLGNLPMALGHDLRVFGPFMLGARAEGRPCGDGLMGGRNSACENLVQQWLTSCENSYEYELSNKATLRLCADYGKRFEYSYTSPTSNLQHESFRFSKVCLARSPV